MKFVISVAVFLSVGTFAVSCGGEKRIFKGTLTTTVEKSGSGDYIGSGNDEVDVTVTKHSENKISLNFKTVGFSKIKTEMENCTLQMVKSGNNWTVDGSIKCSAEGQEYQIVKGTGLTSGKDIRLAFEAVPFGTGKTNKYRFEGTEN